VEQSTTPTAKTLEWIRRYPLLLIVLGHCLFFIGIWNVQIGFGEDTPPMGLALANAPHLVMTSNLYVDLFTLILGLVTPDPMLASVVMRFLVSLLTAVTLFLVLSRFSSRLKMEAILFACFIWIASRLNAPTIQYTSQNGFAFAIMLMGIYCLFSERRAWGFFGFVCFSVAAISLRLEYFAPFLLILLFLAGPNPLVSGRRSGMEPVEERHASATKNWAARGECAGIGPGGNGDSRLAASAFGRALRGPLPPVWLGAMLR
jgi:hypothetical protein